MLALMKLYPRAEHRPQQQRRLQLDGRHTFTQNNTQWMSRVDYNISDSTKLFVRYNLQRETQPFPMQLVVHQSDPAAALSDPGARQEPVGLGNGFADPRVQSDHDQ